MHARAHARAHVHHDTHACTCTQTYANTSAHARSRTLAHARARSWWLPRLDAVYYALASNFGTRAWVSALVLPRPWLWRFMTASAVCVEGLAPVLLVVGVCACGRAREGAGGRKERAPPRVHLAARRRDGGSVSAGGGFAERTALAARTAGALALAALHAGLMVATRLANWQVCICVCALGCVVRHVCVCMSARAPTCVR